MKPVKTTQSEPASKKNRPNHLAEAIKMVNFAHSKKNK